MTRYLVTWTQLESDLFAGQQQNGLFTGRLHDAQGSIIKKRTALPDLEAVRAWAVKERARVVPASAVPAPPVVYHAPVEEGLPALSPPAAWQVPAPRNTAVVHALLYPQTLADLTAADVDRAEAGGQVAVLAAWVRRLMHGDLREEAIEALKADESFRAEMMDDDKLRAEVEAELLEDDDFRDGVRHALKEDDDLRDEARDALRDDLRQDVLDDLRAELVGEVREELRVEMEQALAAEVATATSTGAWVAAAALLPLEVATAVSKALAERLKGGVR